MKLSHLIRKEAEWEECKGRGTVYSTTIAEIAERGW